MADMRTVAREAKKLMKTEGERANQAETRADQAIQVAQRIVGERDGAMAAVRVVGMQLDQAAAQAGALRLAGLVARAHLGVTDAKRAELAATPWWRLWRRRQLRRDILGAQAVEATGALDVALAGGAGDGMLEVARRQQARVQAAARVVELVREGASPEVAEALAAWDAACAPPEAEPEPESGATVEERRDGFASRLPGVGHTGECAAEMDAGHGCGCHGLGGPEAPRLEAGKDDPAAWVEGEVTPPLTEPGR